MGFLTKNRPVIFFCLKLVFGILILAYLFNAVDYELIFKEMKVVSIPLYVLVVLGHFAIMGIKSYRWLRLCRTMNVEVSYKQALYAYSAAFSLGILSPGQIGDFSKVLLVDAKKYERKKILIAAFEDRLWDVIGLVFTCFLCLFVMVFVLRVKDAFLTTYFLGALVVVLLFIILFKPALRFLKNRYQTYLRTAFMRWRGSLLLTIVTIVVQLIRWAVLAMALNYEIVWSALSATIGTFVALIPISIAGIGTREATLVYLFGLKDIDAKFAIAFSLLMFSAYVVGAIVGGVLIVLKRTNGKNTATKARS
ncbi:MAG: flippase-like domain-containing protein [Proteobacteria bacterium]|nr:flippase-like domain-containing protein [Pseudomonadota bacterium]